MKRQKGQDIVEFALLLPIFLLVLCGIIYCGFMFGDYQTVQGIVRNAAREAAVVGHYTESTDPSQPINNYKIIADKYNQILKEQNVITHLYVPDAVGVQVVSTNDENKKPENSVHAKLRLELTKSDVSFVNYIQNVVGMPTEYVVNCFMYDETTKTST
uniref:TadE/TadG family type IV pilus assembly protein n=1 Tax=Dialister sp. TaxID=1955814 RepID=UPI004025F945